MIKKWIIWSIVNNNDKQIPNIVPFCVNAYMTWEELNLKGTNWSE